LGTFSPDAAIFVGAGAGMSACTIGIGAVTRIRVGQGTLIGAGATIIDSDFHPICPQCRLEKPGYGASEPVDIGDNCLIGMNVLVLKGCSLGTGSTLGAGSVLTSGSYQGDRVYAGSPACFRGEAGCADHSRVTTPPSDRV
jgi:maltose O-acetyltransferase